MESDMLFCLHRHKHKNKRTFYTLLAAILMFLSALLTSSEAAQFNLGVSGGYSSNLEREHNGSAGSYVSTSLNGSAAAYAETRMPLHLNLNLEDIRYSAGGSGQHAGIDLESIIWQRGLLQLSIVAAGEYMRNSRIPADDFFGPAAQIRLKLHASPTLDLGMAQYMQWRYYIDAVSQTGQGRGNDTMEHSLDSAAHNKKLDRDERTRRSSLFALWQPSADISIAADGGYADNSASISHEEWYAWDGSIQLEWWIDNSWQLQVWGHASRQRYSGENCTRADTISAAGATVSRFTGQWQQFLTLEWERDSSNKADESYIMQALTCGIRYYF